MARVWLSLPPCALPAPRSRRRSKRASSSPSQRPRDADLLAARRPRSTASCRAGSGWRRSGRRRRPGCGRSSGSCAPGGSPWRRGSPARSAGCCRPRRRASRRSTGRRRRRSRCSGARRPAAAARGTGRRWCPGTRRPGCSGTGAGTAASTSGLLREERQVVQQQVAEVAGVQRPQPLLVGGVELAAACRGRSRRSPTAGTWSGRQPRFFQRWIDRRPAARGGQRLLVDVRGLDDLLDQPLLVVGVEDGEVRLAGRPARRGGAGSARRSRGRCRASMPSTLRPISALDAARASRARPCW